MANRARTARLASLAALGGAALAACPGGADGAVVVVPLNLEVGYSAGFASKATVHPTTKTGSSHPAFTLARSGAGSSRLIVERSIGGSIGFRPASSGSPPQIAFVTKGATAAGARTGRLKALFAGTARTATSNGATRRTYTSPTPFTDHYALFQFTTASRQTDYGWLELSLADPAAGPDITLLGAAYDTSGALLPAGSLTSPAAVPEPSSLAIELSGLAALAFGAAGTRRWRAARARRAGPAAAQRSGPAHPA